jgi:hypothetical protein
VYVPVTYCLILVNYQNGCRIEYESKSQGGESKMLVVSVNLPEGIKVYFNITSTVDKF